MENFEFHNPTKLLFGKGEIEKIANEIVRYGNKILIVTGGGSVKKIGILDQAIVHLEASGCTWFHLEGIEPNPRLTTIQKGIEICKREGIEIVLAIGGGSVIDASKAICAGAMYDGDVWDFYTRKSTIRSALPLGTVLTLAATGSEMNGNSVVTNWETQEKLAVGSNKLLPKFSILDPTYTYSVPKDHTVYGIVDIMSHVFEQYFSHTSHTPLQDRFSEAILKTVIENATKVIDNPKNYDARANILLSSTFALNGLINIGKTTDWATHAIEHAVSAVYDIPHGGGLAILFPHWMAYVMDNGIEKFVTFAVNVWNVETEGKTDKEIALEGITKTREFFNRIGAPSQLKNYNIGSERIEEMAEKAVRGGTIGSYKRLTKEDVIKILQESL